MSSLSPGASGEARLMTRSWSEVERSYRWLVDGGLNVRGMLHLVEQIEASQYARALHAWTSMHDLCIAQQPVSDGHYDSPYLRISPLFDGTVEFRYVDTYIAARQWHRRVKEEDAFRRLERFIDQLRWVVRDRMEAP